MGGTSNGYLKPRLSVVTFFKNRDIFVDIYRKEQPNKPAEGNAGIARQLTVGHHWPGLLEPERWHSTPSHTNEKRWVGGWRTGTRKKIGILT